jgi:hypothetical protein
MIPNVGSLTNGREPAATFLRFIALPSLICCLSLPIAASASKHRSRAVAREFQREHPCLSTGRAAGACPGYWRDHVVPLACGAPDAVSNVRWQTVADARAKDAWERRGCGR